MFRLGISPVRVSSNLIFQIPRNAQSMVQRYIRPLRLQPRPRGRTPPHPIGHPKRHHPRALRPEPMSASTSKISPTQGQVFSFAVPAEHCDSASDPRIAAQQWYGLMAFRRPKLKRSVRPGMREILLSLLPNTAECRMIPSSPHGRDSTRSGMPCRHARGYKAASLPGRQRGPRKSHGANAVIPTLKEIAWPPFPYF